MKKLSTVLLIFAFFAGSVQAHRDRILHIDADGSIRGLPAVFGPVRLIVEGLGSEYPLIQLRIGKNQTTLPSCVTRTVHTKNIEEIQIPVRGITMKRVLCHIT
jgi:uncharacterized GH25 family protein